MNDNERKGLPKDIDLLETAINLLKMKPNEKRRIENLLSCIERVTPQVKIKLEEVTSLERKFEYDFSKALHQGFANSHVSNHKVNHHEYLPENNCWLEWQIK